MQSKKQATAIICLSPNDGGMELYSLKLAKELNPHLQIITIVKKDSFLSKKIASNGNITMETVSFSTTLSISLIIQIRRIIQHYKIKNIIFFGASELKSIYFSLLGLDVNLIVRHGTTKSRPKKDLFHKLIYSNVNYHIGISKHLLNNVHYIIPFGKTTQEKLIYNSIPSIPTKLKEKKSDKISLVHVGRVAFGKGHEDAIQACEILVDHNIDFEFNIVGSLDRGYEERFLKFYEECPYKNKINLVGFKNDVTPYLRKANIFIFPSYGEGLGNAFIEALSFNLACISYNNTTFPEFQDLGFHLHMAADRNIQDLSVKLLYVVQNLKKELELSSKNNIIAQELFSIERITNEYLSILK